MQANIPKIRMVFKNKGQKQDTQRKEVNCIFSRYICKGLQYGSTAVKVVFRWGLGGRYIINKEWSVNDTKWSTKHIKSIHLITNVIPLPDFRICKQNSHAYGALGKRTNLESFKANRYTKLVCLSSAVSSITANTFAICLGLWFCNRPRTSRRERNNHSSPNKCQSLYRNKTRQNNCCYIRDITECGCCVHSFKDAYIIMNSKLLFLLHTYGKYTFWIILP